MADAARLAGDADSSRAPCLISGLKGSTNVHCDATMTVHQFYCILQYPEMIRHRSMFHNSETRKKNQSDSIKVQPKKFDYSEIADRFRTVTYS